MINTSFQGLFFSGTTTQASANTKIQTIYTPEPPLQGLSRDVFQQSTPAVIQPAKAAQDGLSFGKLGNLSNVIDILFGASQVKPLLAKEVNLDILQYPVYASHKIDGWRGMVKDGKIVTKSMKPAKNEAVQQALGRPEFNGLDGELVAGNEVDPDVLRNTSSMMQTKDAKGDFTFFVFDKWDEPDLPYQERYAKLQEASKNWPPYIKLVPQIIINSQTELNAFEDKALEEGYEGVMVRQPDSEYKYGRSGVQEAKLLKLKRFSDDEAVVTGIYEDKSNPGQMAGILVKDLKTGVEFAIRTGFSNKEKEEIWNNQDQFIGKLAKYKHFPYGAKDKPRHATFLEFRDESDMSDDTVKFSGNFSGRLGNPFNLVA